MHSNKNSPPDYDLTFKLTHITFNLGLEQLKDRTIKPSAMSLALCSIIILEFYSFQNKTESFYCMTLSNLSIYVVFVDPYRGNKDAMPFSSYN
jgi:hypothetical protein